MDNSKSKIKKYMLVESAADDEFLQTHRLFNESSEETKTRMKIVNALRNDGAGHSYPEAAERVKNKFKLQIIPTADDPDFVAATDINDNIILLAEALANALFSEDKSVALYARGAVCMLIRHELLHHLLKHMIREIQLLEGSLGKEVSEHLGNFASSSMSHLLNCLEDFDIGRAYTALDKSYVRELKIGARVINGLLPELYAQDWQNMTLEEMWDSLLVKIDQFENDIKNYGLPEVLQKLDTITAADKKKKEIFGKYETTGDSYIQNQIARTKLIYMMDDSPSAITEDNIFDFIDHGYKVPTIDDQGNLRYMALNKKLRPIVDGIAEYLKNNSIGDTEVKALRQKIADSNIVQTVDLFGDGKVLLYSPEEKALAQDVLKKCRPSFMVWYEKFRDAIDTFTNAIAMKLQQDKPDISQKDLVDSVFTIVADTFNSPEFSASDKEELKKLIKNAHKTTI